MQLILTSYWHSSVIVMEFGAVLMIQCIHICSIVGLCHSCLVVFLCSLKGILWFHKTSQDVYAQLYSIRIFMIILCPLTGPHEDHQALP